MPESRRGHNKENEGGSRRSRGGKSRQHRDGSPADMETVRARIRELEAQVARTEQRAENAEAQLRDSQTNSSTTTRTAAIEEDSVPRPQRPSKVPMREIRAKLGVGKEEWCEIRGSLRRNFGAACFERNKPWNQQRKDRIGAALAATDEEHPKLKMFVSRWATYRIATESWDNMRSNASCAPNPNTYRGRMRAARRAAQLERARAHSSTPGPSRSQQTSSQSPSQSPSRSPSPLPSSRRPLQPRPLPNEEEEEDDLMDFEDEEEDDLMDFEDEEPTPSGKGKGVDPRERGGRA